MKQKIYEHHFKVEVNGGLEGINLDAIISEVERDGYAVKQISTCYSDKRFPSREDYDAYIHIFLLADKS